jgi:hypothetical protein
MTIDKKLISHIIAELLIISGLAFYYHKKCISFQSQINELNLKLEKLNGVNFLNTIKRHEQFEIQTVQHINKLYSIINNINSENKEIISNVEYPKMNNNTIKENYYQTSNENKSNENKSTIDPSDTILQSKNSFTNINQNISQKSNPLMNTLSMLGPLTTMFKVVMEPNPPHPNEVFEKIDIKSQLNKIVEIEDDDLNSEILDNELKDELNDLRSNDTSTLNTPIFTPKISLISNSIPSMELCDNSVCKNVENNLKEIQNNIDISTKFEQISTEKNNEKKEIDKSSPLRYITQPLENKRGRPKKT